jgi:glyoxylase-like metal-dependent hydrolase (beta-lactamase superfamily II)
VNAQVRSLNDILLEGESHPSPEWQLRVIQSEQCLSYVAWNERTKEALLIDPKDEDIDAYRMLHGELKDYLWLGVIDSHTHADHISIAAQIADEFKAPLIMHAHAPSQRVQVRVAKSTSLPARAAPIKLISTPGHTQDAITPIWGPFLFGGDTVLFGDTGRDDLPGGDAEDHYDSIQTLKQHATPNMIVLPGHDHKGGRASSWATQLRLNSSLTQNRQDFIRESSSFDAPAPKLLKKSLKENFR